MPKQQSEDKHLSQHLISDMNPSVPVGISLGIYDDRAEMIDVVNGELDGLTSAQLDADIELRSGDDSEPPLAYLARRWRELPDVVNLLQSQYTPARPPTQNVYRWRSVASLAGIWLLLGLIGMAAQGIWSGVRADDLSERSVDLRKRPWRRVEHG